MWKYFIVIVSICDISSHVQINIKYPVTATVLKAGTKIGGLIDDVISSIESMIVSLLSLSLCRVMEM